MAGDRNDVLAEAAGITAGSWLANPAGKVGHELIAAGMLIMAGGGRGVPLDYAELERWTRVGYERGTAAWRGECRPRETQAIRSRYLTRLPWPRRVRGC